MPAPRLAFFCFVSDENGRSQEREPGISVYGHREKQQLGLSRKEAFLEEVALSSDLKGGGDGLREDVPGRGSFSSAQERALPLSRVVGLWGTQDTLTPEEVRVPSRGWWVCEESSRGPGDLQKISWTIL